MEQNSSEADSSVSTSSRRANRRTVRLRRIIRLRNLYLDRKQTVFWRSFHMRGTGFYIFATRLLNSPKHPSCNPRKKYLDELWSKIRLRFILRRIIRLTDNASRLITRLKYKFGQCNSLGQDFCTTSNIYYAYSDTLRLYSYQTICNKKYEIAALIINVWGYSKMLPKK